jgi:hypothetical protein
LIIIFVFDPLAVALVIAFSNAVKVDRGIVDKEKVIRKRELYNEIPDEDNDDWYVGGDVNDDSESVAEPINENIGSQSDLNKDGIITEEEKRKFYEETAWRNSYEGDSYFKHPWFNWNKRERWINDRSAINYWLNFKGGTQNSLDTIKKQINKSRYPDNFDSKTY